MAEIERRIKNHEKFPRLLNFRVRGRFQGSERCSSGKQTFLAFPSDNAVNQASRAEIIQHENEIKDNSSA